MNTIIQATTISGGVIEEAKWSIEFNTSPNESHKLSLSFMTNDQSLINYITRSDRRGILLDGDNTEGYSVSIECDINSIKHMIDTGSSTGTTIVIVSASNRTSEQVLLYLIDPSLCSVNFVKTITS